MTSFTWLDYSEHERQQAMEVIDLFREDDTRDELGLGTIRDPLSDLLFPGTSTIQTRARYFLFVPWVYKELERRRIPAREFSDRLRKYQGKLRDALVAGGEEVGVIGYRAGLHVQRLPSSVYWVGLRKWGVLRFDGTEDDFRRYIDLHYRRIDSVLEADGGEAMDVPKSLWDPHLPSAPDGLLGSATLDLTRNEAEYLVDRVAGRFPRSLLAHLLLTRQTIAEDIGFAWEMRWTEPLNPSLLEQITHAQNFSEVMHGAALLYNLLLAEGKAGGEYVEHYRDELDQWRTILSARQAELHRWDRTAFWDLVKQNGARVPEGTFQFVKAWFQTTLDDGNPAGLADNAKSRQLIIDRERSIKRSRARIGNQRALENRGGSAGAAQLNYRWSRPVRAFVNDILLPLSGVGAKSA